MKATVLMFVLLSISALAQDAPTIKITKYQPAGTRWAHIELSTSKGTKLSGTCEFEKPHPMLIPQADGTRVTVPGDDGKPLMQEVNCAYLSEHVGESIQLFTGEDSLAKCANVGLGSADEIIKWYQSDHLNACRFQDEIHFAFHIYNPHTKTSSDQLVWLKVFKEEVSTASSLVK